MSRLRVASLVLTWLWTTLAVPGSAAAQSAAIRGGIVDEQGRAIAGATVSVANVSTGITRNDESDAAGLHAFEGLPNGTDTIMASRTGFATAKQQSTVLQVGAVVHLDFALESRRQRRSRSPLPVR